jgi:hypothetical protein
MSASGTDAAPKSALSHCFIPNSRLTQSIPGFETWWKYFIWVAQRLQRCDKVANSERL